MTDEKCTMTDEEHAEKIADWVASKYRIGLSPHGAITLNGGTVTVAAFDELVDYSFSITSMHHRRRVLSQARTLLRERVLAKRERLKPKWDFFECFTINRLGVPCHNGVPFKPFLKYIKAIAKAHGSNLDDMEILKIKMEIDQRLESDV